MRKWITGILFMLLMAPPVYAVELCVTITAARDAQVGRQATRIGITKEALARQAIQEKLDYNRAIRWEELRFSNYSAICADNNSCD